MPGSPRAGGPDLKRLRVTLDPLPIKRIQAIDEAGNEEAAEEPASDQKLLTLLPRVDFRPRIAADEKDAEAAKGREAEEAPEEWPWQGAIEQLVGAQEELRVVLDLIAQVESGQGVTVANVGRAKLAPSEHAANLALQVSVKQKVSQDVGKGLQNSAQAMGRELEHHGLFYGALMRLQRQWKVRRQRPPVGAAASETASFAVDLSLRPPSEGPVPPSHRTAPFLTVPLERDQSGVLSAHPPLGRPLRSLHVDLVGGPELDGLRRDEHLDLGPEAEVEVGRAGSLDGGPEEGGASLQESCRKAQAVLQRVQATLLDEQLFDAVEREAFSPGGGGGASAAVTDMGGAHLDLSTGHGATLRFHLQRLQEPRPRPPKPPEGAPTKVKLEPLDTSAELAEPGEVGRGQEDRGIEGAAAGPAAREAARTGAGPAQGPALAPARGGHRAALEIFTRQVYLQGPLGGRAEHRPSLMARGPARPPLGQGSKAEGRGGQGGGGARGRAPGAELPGGAALLDHIVPVASHRAVRARVLALLERQVTNTPHLQLQSRATWHPTTSAWDLHLRLPVHTAAAPAPVPAPEKTESPAVESPGGRQGTERTCFQCTVVVRGEDIGVEGVHHGALPLVPSPDQHEARGGAASAGPCSLTELASFLGHQVALQMAISLHGEALSLGLPATRRLLAVRVLVEGKGAVELVATPSSQASSVLWLVQGESNPQVAGSGPGSLEGLGRTVAKKGCWGRGGLALSWEDLREVLLDLLVFQ